MGTFKSPIYLRIDKSTASSPYRIGMAAGIPLSHADNTVVVLKFDIEIDEIYIYLTDRAIDINTVIKLGGPPVNKKEIIAGLMGINEDLKEI